MLGMKTHSIFTKYVLPAPFQIKLVFLQIKLSVNQCPMLNLDKEDGM